MSDSTSAALIASVTTHLVRSPFSYGIEQSDSTGIARPTHQMPKTMNCLLVRVETSSGLVGWGEAFGFALVECTRKCVVDLIAPAAVGLDALDIETTMRTLNKRFHNFGRNGPVTFALSGIDIALWDIRAKHTGRLLCAVLGGALRSRIRTYASLLPYGNATLVARNETYSLFHFIHNSRLTAAAAVEQGFGALKLHEVDIACIQAAHHACPHTQLMLDVNCAHFSVADAAAFCRAVGADEAASAHLSSSVEFVEEPLWPPEDLAGLAAVREASSSTLIAAGENWGCISDFEASLHYGSVDIVQPSVTKCGGLTALLAIHRLVQQHNARTGSKIRLVPHSPYFGPGLLATAHFLATLVEDEPLELYYCTLAYAPYPQLLCVGDDSRVALPDADSHGLGFELNAAALAHAE